MQLTPFSPKTPQSHSANILDLTQNDQILVGYFASLTTEATRIAYKEAVFEFFTLCSEIKDLSQITKHHVGVYRHFLIKKGLSNNTINKKISALSSFFRYLSDPSVAAIRHNFCAEIKRLTSSKKKETAALSKDEVRKVFSSINPKKFNASFIRTFLCFGFYAGLRVHEICSLTLSNIQTDSGIPVIRFDGKGGKIRQISLHPVIQKNLSEHKEFLSTRGFDLQDPLTPIFPNLQQPVPIKPISQSNGRRLAECALKRSGITCENDARRFSSHCMRATFATRLAELDVPFDELQKELGHASIQTTMMYVKRAKDPARSPAFKIDF